MKKNLFIRNERQFSDWFRKNYRSLGYSEIVRGDIMSCPDFIMLKDGKEVGVELETLASNYILHRHDLAKVDEIVCLIKDIELGKPIIVAKTAKHKIPKTVSISVDEDLWKKVKIHCINEGFEISDFVEKTLREELRR